MGCFGNVFTPVRINCSYFLIIIYYYPKIDAIRSFATLFSNGKTVGARLDGPKKTTTLERDSKETDIPWERDVVNI